MVTVDQLLYTTVHHQGSDLHLKADSPPLIRIHGDLIQLELEPFTADDTRALAFSVLSPTQRSRFEEELELDFAYEIPGLARFRGLRAEPLGEPLDSTFGIDQLLAAGEERMAVIADFEVQLRLRGPRLPRRAARAARLDVMVLGVNPFLHGLLLRTCEKTTVYHRLLSRTMSTE